MKASMENEKLYMLIQAIRLAALEYSEQISMFPAFVLAPDEIAQILNDAVAVFASSDIKKSIKDGTFRKIIELDKYFDQLPKSEYTIHALESSPLWEKSRGMAKEILLDMNIEINDPDLYWLRYI